MLEANKAFVFSGSEEKGIRYSFESLEIDHSHKWERMTFSMAHSPRFYSLVGLSF